MTSHKKRVPARPKRASKTKALRIAKANPPAPPATGRRTRPQEGLPPPQRQNTEAST